LQWAPSGDLYFTATTAPRLRQGNNFRIWHYTGSLLYEQMWPEKQELLELTWQQYPVGKFKENSISYEKVEGIQSSQAQASEKKYVPPNVRNMGSESSSPQVSYGPIPGLPPGYSSSKQQNNTKKPKTHANNHQQVNKEKDPKTTTNNDKADDDKKKASAIRKKLKDIRLLKEKQEKGEKLDKQQLKKISSESELMTELSSLKLS
jgi:translation initiation factor 2A